MYPSNVPFEIVRRAEYLRRTLAQKEEEDVSVTTTVAPEPPIVAELEPSVEVTAEEPVVVQEPHAAVQEAPAVQEKPTVDKPAEEVPQEVKPKRRRRKTEASSDSDGDGIVDSEETQN